jgi:PD-(D/E)XK endonuclease
MTASEDGTSRELSRNQKGAIAETAVAHAAVKLGADVYRPLVEGGRFDLILGVGSQLLRTQCKWAVRVGDVIRVWLRTSRHTPRGYVQTTYSKDEVDVIAAYCLDLDRCYLLPISLVSGQRAIYLRLQPTQNNQALGIHWAKQYELSGAIAQLGERCDGIAEAAGSSPASSTHATPL